MPRATTAARRPSFPRPDRLLRLDLPKDRFLGKALGHRSIASLEKAFGLDQINALYDGAVAQGPVAPGGRGYREFIGRILAALNVKLRIAKEDLARIPKKGPFVVVANHPFGALDGLILSAVLSEARDDVKVMANYLIGRVPELKDLFLLVDPFQGEGAAGRNIGPMRQSLRWLKDGHVLAAFPAGEVAHLKLSNLKNPEGPVTDPAWNGTIARIITRAEVPVLPVYFDGRNNALFQAAGLIHPLIRTVLLPRAFLGKHDSEVTLRVGSLIPAKRIADFESEQQVTDYLRRRTFHLRNSGPRPSIAESSAATPNAASDTAGSTQAVSAVPDASHKQPMPGAKFAKSAFRAMQIMRARFPFAHQPKTMEEIIPPVDPALMEAEMAALPRESALVEHDGLVVIDAKASQIRLILREIGRLREITFRQVGEGTGKSLDLDTFDYDYRHLFIWNRQAREIVGAYRLGQTDLLLQAKGRQGLYTSTLFNYKAELLNRLNPALEMGRSFVRPEYQKSYSPLLLLWKGIGHFLVQNRQYRYLFGPVSISNSYQTASREIMVNFLKMHHAMPEGETLAAPKNPFKPKRPLRLGLGKWDDEGIRRLLQDDEEVSNLVSDLEPDQKGIPVLIRQYLKLGAKFLAFNVDRDFGDCLDGLIVVDLLHTEARVLERYMTKPGYADFVAHHRGTATSPQAAKGQPVGSH
ncbi:lysophospholipid acyltransferase family protein [Humisphaera borealis]|uniref:Lysophospholipid acyltransferase family protein n=1 Tax=Humisphaera borealis TaxID=2807512 RepID=A0A7M2X3I9_9BACT|nr:GNAT family N-acyltransferase [Humisphaera borealis]QOV92244.1 lysophospholipid acyltransferase family protein [Humisphaera borealis]